MKEVIVVGAGLMGSSAAWQLTERGLDVMLIEQQDLVYNSGSSLGEARIARALGPEGDLWAFLHNKSLDETQLLIDYLNFISEEKHSMTDLYTTSPVSYVFYEEEPKLGGFESVLDNRSEFCEYAFSDEEARKKFNMQMPAKASALIREFKEHSGTLDPRELIRKLHLALKGKGNSILYNTRVESIKEQKGIYSVETLNLTTGENSVLTCSKLMVAAGAYSGLLLKNLVPAINKIIKPQRVFLSFFKINKKVFNAFTDEQKKALLNAYPAIYFTPELSYAMIEAVDTDGIPIIKIGGHFCRSEIEDVHSVWEQKLSEDEINWSAKNTLQHLKDALLPVKEEELQFIRGYSCVYSLTKNEIPIVSAVVDKNRKTLPDFVFMGGMSGVGAKGAMAYGKIAADLLLGKIAADSAYLKAVDDLSFFNH